MPKFKTKPGSPDVVLHEGTHASTRSSDASGTASGSPDPMANGLAAAARGDWDAASAWAQLDIAFFTRALYMQAAAKASASGIQPPKSDSTSAGLYL